MVSLGGNIGNPLKRGRMCWAVARSIIIDTIRWITLKFPAERPNVFAFDPQEPTNADVFLFVFSLF